MPFILFFIALVMVATPATGSGIKPLVHQGERFIRLDELASFYGGEIVPSPLGQVFIRAPRAELEFKPDSRELRIGRTIVWMHETMKKVANHWVISETDALKVIDPVMRPPEYLRNAGYRVVMIDPGHGGLDTGARGLKHGVEEKRAVLDISRRVRNHLTAAGVKVYMTRENDRYIELEERSRMTARRGADLFVSIHLNSASGSTAQGIETYVLIAAEHSSTAGGSKSPALPGNRYDPGSALLGFYLQHALIQQVKTVDRGLKRSRFIVLRNAPCPAALVELGFLSHAGEERKIMQEDYREMLAQAIVKGIMNYINTVRQSQRGPI